MSDLHIFVIIMVYRLRLSSQNLFTHTFHVFILQYVHVIKMTNVNYAWLFLFTIDDICIMLHVGVVQVLRNDGGEGVYGSGHISALIVYRPTILAL